MIHAPSVQEFDPTPAINLWCYSGSRSRRPEVVPKRSATAIEQPDSDPATETDSEPELDEPSIDSDDRDSDMDND